MKILSVNSKFYTGSKSEDLKQSAEDLKQSREDLNQSAEDLKRYTGSSLPDLILAKLPYLFFGLLLLIWFAVPGIIGRFDPTAAAVDPSIWMLLIFSLISYFLLLGISIWLLRTICQALGLPEMNTMVSKFNNLQSWQQLKFCFALFALLLLAAVGVLSAII